jgi:hypothetical protein
MFFLAQTTQQSGMFPDVPAGWSSLLTAAAAFIVAMTGLIAALKSSNKAGDAMTKATEAKATADGAQRSNDRISDGLHQTNAAVNNIALNQLPPTLQQRADFLNAAQQAKLNRPDNST